MPIVSACSCLFRKHADAPVSGRPEDIHRECGYHRAMREAAEQQSKSWGVDDLMRTIYEIDKLAHEAVEEDEDPQDAWETCRRIYEKTLAARILFANHKPNPNPSGLSTSAARTGENEGAGRTGPAPSGSVGLGPSQPLKPDCGSAGCPECEAEPGFHSPGCPLSPHSSAGSSES